MHAAYDSINKEAGSAVLREMLYLAPQYSICKYTFERRGVDYEMRLLLSEDGPKLLFSLRKTHDGAKGHAIRNLFSFLARRAKPKIKHELGVCPSTVNDIDVRQWFSYLLSGFRKGRKPREKKPSVATAS